MKRIACLGRIHQDADQQTSEGILEIYNRLRIVNTQAGITGLFVPYNDMVLQILEGDVQKVALSMYKLRKDPQITDLTIIAESDIPTTQFPSWRAKFFHPDMANHREFLQNLKQGLLTIGTTQDANGELASQFWTATLTSTTSHKANESLKQEDFRNHSFHMKAWPRQTRSRFTPQLIKLCSSLTTGWIGYQNLVDSEFYATTDELNSVLTKLLDSGVLLMKDSPEQEQAPEPAEQHKSAADRFTSLMHRFISSKRQEKSA